MQMVLRIDTMDWKNKKDNPSPAMGVDTLSAREWL
jgi:hypothetical protein